MSHRTQITLTDDQYERLRAESQRTGVALAELVRRALDRAYGATASDRIRDGLEASFASWTDRRFDGSAYVDGLRGGMARRLTDA
jgi:predicted DNA-binding protein